MISLKPLFFRLCAVAGLFILQTGICGQTTLPTPTLNTSLIPPSPNAATFAKVGNIPVTLYNGLPNISLPIFTVSVGSLSLPISVDYDYSGFKPKEEASWVGMGWNLTAGGVVTRIVKGDPDGSQSTGYNYGDINAYDSSLNFPQNQTFLGNVALHTYDAEPDIFTFNFNGRSGKFIYYHGKGYVMPFMKLNITMATDQSLIKIIDEAGTIYLFQSVEISNPHPQPDYSMPAYKSSWFLSKIVSADLNDTISLGYTSVQMQEGSSPYSETYTQWNTQSCPGSSTNPAMDHYSGYSYGGTQVLGLQLSTITSRNFNVNFTPTSWNRADVSGTYPALGSITVSNNFGDVLKSFNFNYSYFGNSSIGYLCKLRLDSLQDITGLPSQTYVFGYNGGAVLPDKRTLGIDYWGYYNGWDNNLSLFPTSAFTAKVNGNGVRTPAFASAETGALTTLNYPEGGATAFTYELNDYRDETTGITTPGPGIRVKTMTSYDPAGISNQFIKNFYYKDASGNSTGVLVATPEFIPHVFVDQTSIPVEAGSGGNWIYQQCIEQFNNYTTDFVTANGTIVNQGLYYSYVKEITGSNDTTARSDYYYNCNCGHQYDYFTGVQLTKQVDYKNTGHSSYSAVKETDNNYNMQLDTLFNGIKPYLYERIDFGSAPGLNNPNVYRYDLYNVPVAWSYLGSQTDKLFDDQGNTFTTTKTYNYNPVTRNVASTLTAMSDGRTMLQKMKYPEDYAATVAGKLVTAHVVGPVLEEQIWLKNSGTDSSLVAGKITAYDSVLFKPTGEYYFENSSPPVKSMNSETTSGGLYTSLISDSRYVQRVFYKYSTYGLLQQQNLSRDNINSFIWGYNSSLPLAAVKNAAATNIAYAGFEDGSNGGWVLTGSTLSGGATGSHAFNGQLQKTVASGSYVVTLWSYGAAAATVNSTSGTALITKNNWTLYQWQLSNVTSVTVAGTNLDDVRLYPAGAQMTTYTYRPGIGTTTQSDINNRVSFYEYDSFGRLQLIRDADRNIIKLYKYHYRPGTAGSNPLQ